MANTYSQIYCHIAFAVSQRAGMVAEKHREKLQKYIAGIADGLGQKLIAIYCMPDHTHILLGLKPDAAPSEIVGKIKSGSTNHINEQHWFGCHFAWQEGFGAFSVSHSHLGRVIECIRTQPEHHHRKTFQEEYAAFLERNDVPFDERYVFKPLA